MKRRLLCMLLITLILILTACSAGDSVSPTVKSVDTPTPTSLLQQSEPPSPTIWPEAYSSILEEYKTLADYIYHDVDYSFYDFIADSDDSCEWQTQNLPDLDGIVLELVIDGSHYRDRDDLGYSLKDLNGDGSDELILLSKEYKVFAVYSTVDGRPKLLDSYWDRYRCYTIDESGLLYIHCFYDSAEDWYYTIERLSDDGSELLPKERYGMESYDYDTGERYTESHYYKVIYGKKYSEREIISESEFDEFLEKNSVFADWEKAAEITKSAVVFIPVLD